MTSKRAHIIGAELAALTALAAMSSIETGEPLPRLRTVDRPKPKAKSSSLERMLRKVKP